MTEALLTAHDRLERALREFARSPRFALFKDIQLGRLMPEECEGHSTLYDMTFEALVGRAGGVLSDRQLCTPAQAESLLHLLEALSEEAAVSEAFSHSAPTSSQQKELNPVDDVVDHLAQGPSLVQLEQELVSLFARIKAHPSYEKFAAKTLGEFWDPTWLPAPFEEMLTIQQLSSLDVATLFKKKTVTENRTANVCQALQRILDALDGVSASHGSSQTGPLWKSPKEFDFASLLPDRMSGHSLAALAVYEVLARGCHDQSEEQLRRLAESFLSHFSAAECADVLLDSELSSRLLRRLQEVVNKAVDPTTLNLIRRLLEGPAVRIDYVVQVLSPQYIQQRAFPTCIATLIARALGASQVQYNGRTYAGFWTLNPHLIYDLLSQKPTRARRRGAKAESIPNHVSLDPFLLELIRVQGRPSLSRKGRPKRLKSRTKGGR